MLAARIIREHGALGAPVGMGTSLVAPTIATHGNPEQIERYLLDIVTGRRWWCQLFSEPGAGSDLAGLATRAVQDGDLWVVNGQKVWTSGGHMADLGMLLARTNPTAPKHQGITWFAIDMHQPGIEVRTLREMTGGAMFSEVFFTDATVPDEARIGELNNGWQVANTTLFHERSGMGAGGDRAAWALRRPSGHHRQTISASGPATSSNLVMSCPPAQVRRSRRPFRAVCTPSSHARPARTAIRASGRRWPSRTSSPRCSASPANGPRPSEPPAATSRVCRTSRSC